MSDTTTGAAAPTDTSTTTEANTTDANATQTTAPETGADSAVDVERWKAMSRENERRFKAASKELDTLKAQSMTDTERAVAEAKVAGRSEALVELAGRLVDAEFRAASAGRLSDDQLGALLEGLNRTVFVDADTGEVDVDAVRKLVDRIAPAAPATTETTPAQPTALDLGQGARTKNLPLNGGEFDRAMRGAVGLRS